MVQCCLSQARREAVEKAMKKNFRAFMGDEQGKEWELPEKGLVELVVTFRPQRVKKWQAVRVPVRMFSWLGLALFVAQAGHGLM